LLCKYRKFEDLAKSDELSTDPSYTYLDVKTIQFMRFIVKYRVFPNVESIDLYMSFNLELFVLSSWEYGWRALDDRISARWYESLFCLNSHELSSNQGPMGELQQHYRASNCSGSFFIQLVGFYVDDMCVQ
jgi:hypothetical protein